jgi:hypothetical protein
VRYESVRCPLHVRANVDQDATIGELGHHLRHCESVAHRQEASADCPKGTPAVVWPGGHAALALRVKRKSAGARRSEIRATTSKTGPAIAR